MFLLICVALRAQNARPSAEASVFSANVRTGSTIRYRNSQWKVVKQIRATFDVGAGPANVVLLRSSEPTGTSGAGHPMNDVGLLILQGGRVVYDYARNRVDGPGFSGSPFLMDDYLEIRDLSHDGTPQILFHSGYRGASDSVTFEHILLYNKSKTSFADVAIEPFYNSGTHGLQWLTLEARTLVVIADRNWPPTVPLEYQCHYCGSPFKYDAYQWNNKTGAFEPYARLRGEKSYSEAGLALKGDWALIQSGFSR